MAFVYRSDKPPTYIQQSNDIGPGYYDSAAKVVLDPMLLPAKRVPFASSVERNNYIMQDTPGPGSYDIQLPLDGQKVIFESAENEIKIMEVPKPISVFKSNTIRFQDKKDFMEPGPGSYEVKEPLYRVQPTKYDKKSSLIEQIMRINKYQSIPSIPGQLHSFGYTENDQNDLEINHNPIIKHTGGLTDMVGPGTYNLHGAFDSSRRRCVSWKKPRPSKVSANNSFQSVGPGSYDTQMASAMHNFKPSVAFTSKSLRTNEQRRGIIQAKFLKDRMVQQSKSFNVGADDESDSDSDLEFIDDTTPGPGSYHYASTASTIASQVKSENCQPFGSSGDRFKQLSNAKPTTVGPGSYTVQLKVKANQYKPPFLSSDTRFDQKVTSNVPGPTFYNPKNSMEEKLISALQKAPLGSFGVNEGRFRDANLQQMPPGPGSYDLRRVQVKGKINNTSSFQSKAPRQGLIQRNNQSPPPGAYDQTANTIAQSCKRDEEDDPELVIQRPAFGIGQKRWVDAKQIPEDEEDDEPLPKTVNDLFKKKPVNLPPFNARTRRFNHSVDSHPGPGEYHEGIQALWNKRTFNIIFAEI